MDEEASFSNKIYTVDDFDNVKCRDVTDLTEDKFTKLMSSGEKANDTTYNRVLCLELEDSSKNYVLDVIEELMQREDVIYAGPDYEISVTSTTPSDYNTNIQWAIDNIDLPDVWDFSTGTNNVVVGVIDMIISIKPPNKKRNFILFFTIM